MSKDLSELLQGWDYDPAEVTVRRILGRDGRPKIQMRLDLGILQMETDGRPDGKRPFGRESLLEHYTQRQHETPESLLTPDQVNELKQEAMQYYYRYLALFHLGDYDGVIRDTERNIRLFDFIRDQAEEENDRTSLEQFRPYVMMMHTRARACIVLDQKHFDEALRLVDEGIDRIEDFLIAADHSELIGDCRELAFLRDWRERIVENRPLSREDRLRREIQLAVAAENYERAAELRDQLRTIAT